MMVGYLTCLLGSQLQGAHTWYHEVAEEEHDSNRREGCFVLYVNNLGGFMRFGGFCLFVLFSGSVSERTEKIWRQGYLCPLLPPSDSVQPIEAGACPWPQSTSCFSAHGRDSICQHPQLHACVLCSLEPALSIHKRPARSVRELTLPLHALSLPRWADSEHLSSVSQGSLAGSSSSFPH